jgi:hypothetical protein
MAEGLLYRSANLTDTTDISKAAIEWLTNNGDTAIGILQVNSVYSNLRGYFYETHYTCADGEGVLEFIGENGSWKIRET